MDRLDSLLELGAAPSEAAAPASPDPCACSHAVLARALDAVLSLEERQVAEVLAVIEAQSPGVRAALAAASEAEAVHLAALSRRVFAAADRLAALPAPPA